MSSIEGSNTSFNNNEVTANKNSEKGEDALKKEKTEASISQLSQKILPNTQTTSSLTEVPFSKITISNITNRPKGLILQEFEKIREEYNQLDENFLNRVMNQVADCASVKEQKGTGMDYLNRLSVKINRILIEIETEQLNSKRPSEKAQLTKLGFLLSYVLCDIAESVNGSPLFNRFLGEQLKSIGEVRSHLRDTKHLEDFNNGLESFKLEILSNIKDSNVNNRKYQLKIGDILNKTKYLVRVYEGLDPTRPYTQSVWESEENKKAMIENKYQ